MRHPPLKSGHAQSRWKLFCLMFFREDFHHLHENFNVFFQIISLSILCYQTHALYFKSK
jgi:hypothetical protein